MGNRELNEVYASSRTDELDVVSDREKAKNRQAPGEGDLHRAIDAYNKVWNDWIGLDATNVDECRKAAMEAAVASICAPDAAMLEAAKWRGISADTAWLDGRDVVIRVRDMEVSARYCPGEWSDDTPITPREYSGAVWSCFDDKFQIEIEECSKDPKQWCHNGVTHWRNGSPRPSLGVTDAGEGERQP